MMHKLIKTLFYIMIGIATILVNISESISMRINSTWCWIKNFRGISVQIADISANAWDGYGLSLIEVKVVSQGSVTLVNSSKSLLYFNTKILVRNEGKELRIYGSFLFFISGPIYVKTLVPEKERCYQCGKLINDHGYAKETDNTRNPSWIRTWCSQDCYEWDT
jgi:hypothetical protein